MHRDSDGVFFSEKEIDISRKEINDVYMLHSYFLGGFCNTRC